MPSQYFVADGSAADAFVYKNVGSAGAGIPVVYVGFDVYVCSSLIRDIVADNTTTDFMEAWDEYGSGGQPYPITEPSEIENGQNEGLSLAADIGPTPPAWYSEREGLVGAPSPVVPGTHTIGFHLDVSGAGAIDWVIDGTPYTLAPSGILIQIDVVTLGAIFSPLFPSSIANITNVTIGTTGYGSTDILADDFSGGTFAAWDGTSGACSISATASCYVPVPTVVFDGQQAFRVGQ